MVLQLKFQVLAACAAICMSHGTPDISQATRHISINEATAQGIIHLPNTHVKSGENQACHYWISISKENSENVIIHHKDFGLSVVPLNIKLQPEDSIFIMSPLDGNDTVYSTEAVTWSSSSNSDSHRLEFIPKYQDVCVVLKGRWRSSTAKLLVTLFFDNTATSDNSCPSEMTQCRCPGSRRCIFEDLMCNGLQNCGIDCDFDESEHASCNKSQIVYAKENCNLAKFQYLFMMVMAGLLLILIPAVFLLTFMYHKKLTMAKSFPAANSDSNNNFNRSNGQYPHVITMSPPNDIPPRYEELSHGINNIESSQSQKQNRA